MFGIRRLVHPVAIGTTGRLIHLSYDKMCFGLMMFLQGQPATLRAWGSNWAGAAGTDLQSQLLTCAAGASHVRLRQ